MTGSPEPRRRGRLRATANKAAVGIGVLVAVVVVGIVILVVWAIAKGEEQSRDWADEVASTYHSTMPGASEADVLKELGEPALLAAETIQGQAARCSVYRVLLTARELVPYRFCYVGGRLLSKSRSWDDIPDD
jgi:hypothetical protein